MQPRTSQIEFDRTIAAVSEVDWARLAAYIDGEGTIMISRTQLKRGRQMPLFVLTLVVANTDMRLLRWLSETFTGEHIFSQSAKQRSFRASWSKKTCYSWRLFEKRAAQVLERVRPYLICKREQADTALAYRALRDCGSKGHKLTLSDIQERDIFRDKMRALNGSKISGVTQETTNGKS